MYWTQTIVERVGGGDALHSLVTEVPADVDFDDLLAFYARELGEPTDIAYAELPEVGPIDVGWVFAVPDNYELPGARDDFEMLVIPLVEDADDPEQLVSAGLAMARVRTDPTA